MCLLLLKLSETVLASEAGSRVAAPWWSSDGDGGNFPSEDFCMLH